jgi:glycosyltransferase involved in cell wall biosynthesis
VIIAGRGAAKLGQAPDIELLSDVPDLARLLRRARVAAVPLRSGTGTPIKVHEAAAGGAAVVSTPWVAEATGANIDTASDACGFAAAIAALLDDEALRLRRVADLRASLLGSSSESVWQVLDVVLARVKVL